MPTATEETIADDDILEFPFKEQGFRAVESGVKIGTSRFVSGCAIWRGGHGISQFSSISRRLDTKRRANDGCGTVALQGSCGG